MENRQYLQSETVKSIHRIMETTANEELIRVLNLLEVRLSLLEMSSAASLPPDTARPTTDSQWGAEGPTPPLIPLSWLLVLHAMLSGHAAQCSLCAALLDALRSHAQMHVQGVGETISTSPKQAYDSSEARTISRGLPSSAYRESYGQGEGVRPDFA